MSQNRPSAPELLTALAELLDQTLLPQLPEGARHSARVGANIARILRREWEALALDRGADDADADLADAEIADADLDPERWRALTEMVRRDLAVAKPGYDAWDNE